MAMPGATEAINNLAQAFRKWLRANFPDGGEQVSKKEISDSVKALRAKLVMFLKMMNSGE